MKAKHYFYAILSSVAALLFQACNDDENVTARDGVNPVGLTSERGLNPDDMLLRNGSNMHGNGYIYTESNEAGTNHIYVYQQNSDGKLMLRGTVDSGGNGNGMGLGSQGALVFNDRHDFLYAVNAGSNSISSFMVGQNGRLTLMHTALTGGTTPVSITVNRRMMYVVHSGSSDISGFHLGAHGSFSYIPNSTRGLSSSNAGPAQISFAPNGNYLYVTEKMTNKITRFSLDANDLPDTGTAMAAVGSTPFGFDFVRDSYMIVSNAEMDAEGAATVTSYTGAATGALSAVNGAVASGQTSACWVATTAHGRYAYISNTGSDTVSSYYIGPQGNLFLINGAIASGDGPIDSAITRDDRSLYVLCKNDHTIRSYMRTADGGLTAGTSTPSLPVSAAGLVSW
jgi:6-phosphogluconolactonase